MNDLVAADRSKVDKQAEIHERFIETIRRSMETLPPDQSGWIAGARDPELGRALTLLHQNPQRSWTIADLAEEVCVSRSVLAERFTRYTGEPPTAYLTRWRLQLGAQMLAETSRGVAEIAAVGYEIRSSIQPGFQARFRPASSAIPRQVENRRDHVSPILVGNPRR